jgi:hypothetical protein
MPPNIPAASPFTPRQVRALKIAVIVMGALLVLGIAAVIFGIARQVSRMGIKPLDSSSAAASPYVQTLTLGPGAVKAVLMEHGLLVLHWQGPSNDVILSFDPRTGKELGRIDVHNR